MNKRIEELLQRIKELENELSLELEQELTKIRQKLSYSAERGKIRFQAGTLAAQRVFKKDLYHFFRESNLFNILTAPVIYSLIVPLLLLDVFLFIYQRVCFPFYKVEKVARSDYLIIDRHHLEYLNIIEKVNCIYCGYGNGLLSYALEIASRTEEYWCPIKHAAKVKDPHWRYHCFSEYGDAEGYKDRIAQFRERVND